MADTRQLLERIAAFRSKLEEVPRLVPTEPANALAGFHRLAALLPGGVAEPAQLTHRAQRLLGETCELIQSQKQLIDDPRLTGLGRPTDADPLGKFHRGTVGLTDSALRLAAAFPVSPEQQLRMCDGYEQLLHVIRHRLGVLNQALTVRRSDGTRLDQLTELLTRLHTGRPVDVETLIALAEQIVDDVRLGGRMRFLGVDVKIDGTARWVAARSLNVAQVLARIAPHDYEWASKPALLVLSGLVMDVGLLDMEPELLLDPETLTGDDLRRFEAHPRRSADVIRRMLPETGPLAEVVVAHHERIDGTGYPNGFRNETIPGPAKFLAVADCYASLVADRPHRPGLDTRTALTDTLLAAEQGHLDRDIAEYLLHLTFYPIGTVVELNDGRLAVVAAVHASPTNIRATMRPVVAVLTDADGTVLPRPAFVDLAATEVGSIVRGLTTAERQHKLGEWYPDLCL